MNEATADKSRSATPVLVVDSPVEVARMIPVFADAGMKVICFSTAERIHRCLTSSECEAALVDIEFALGMGFDVMQDMLHSKYEIPAILASSDPTPAKVLRAWDGGACSFLRKPYDLHKAVKAARDAVESRDYYDGILKKLEELKAENERLGHANKHFTQHAEQFETIEKITKSIASSLELDKVLSEIIASIAHASEFDRVILSIIDWNDRAEEAAMATGVRDEEYEELLSEMVWPLAGEDAAPWASQVFELKQKYSSEGRFGASAVAQKAERLFPGPMEKIPLVVKDVIVGTITVDNCTSRKAISHQHTAMLERFAEYAAIAIMNAKLYMRAVEAQEELKKAQGKLLEAERLATIERLVATVNHEINNPLCSIVLSAQMLETMVLNEAPPVKEKVKSILADVERISQIVSKLRSIQRTPAKTLDSKDDIFDLDELGNAHVS